MGLILYIYIMEEKQTIKFNFDDEESIKKAERKKARLENKGYNLIKDEKIGNFYFLTYSKFK